MQKEEIIDELDSLKYLIFGEASSIVEAQNYAHKLILQEPTASNVHHALSYYHNTLVEQAKKLLRKKLAEIRQSEEEAD